MRICYLGDANVQVRRVAEHFAAGGDEVHLVTARPGPVRGAQVHSFAGRLTRGKSALLLGLPAARRIVKKLRPDLLHVFYATSYGLVASAIPGPPVALSPMGSDVLISARHSRLMRLMVRRAIARADAVFSVAPHMTRALVEMGADPARIHTFPRGVDLDRFPFRTTQRKPERPVVISNRRLEPVYNVGQLIRAAPIVLNRFPGAEFRIYGEGSLRKELEALSTALGVSGSVRFSGAVDHDRIPATLSEGDIYVSCSRSDGASASLLEAMATGLYPVVSDIEANRTWINPGSNGTLVPLDDAVALAEAICCWTGVSAGMADLLLKNRQVIQERASWSASMPRMRAIYTQLTGSV